MKEKKLTIWNRTFVILMFVSFFTSMSQFMLTTVTPKYASTLGLSASIIGMVTSIQAGAAIVVKPFVGPTVDAMNKKKLLILIRILGVVAALAHALAYNAVTLFVARLIFGVSMGFALALNMTMVGDTLPEEKMASGLGVFSLGQALATALGPYLGLEIIDVLGYVNTFYVTVVINLIALALCFLVKPVSNQVVKPFRIDLKNMVALECWRPVSIICLFAMVYGTFSAFLALYGDLKGIENVGLFFTVYAMAMLISRPLSGKIADKFGVLKICLPCSIFFIVAFLLIAVANSLWVLLVAAVFAAFAYGGATPAMQAMCLVMVPKEKRAAASSTNYLGMDLGHFLGPVLAGVVIDHIQGVQGYEIMYLLCIIPVVIALVLALLPHRSPKRDVECG